MNHSLSAVRSVLRRFRTRRAGAKHRITSAALALALIANLVVPVVPVSAATPPTAKAGADRSAPSGSAVKLDGRASFDAAGGVLTYSWAQTSGTTVELTPVTPDGSVVEFFAPLVAASTAYTFELTVSNGTDTDTDSVTINVVPGAMPYNVGFPTGRSAYPAIAAQGRNVYVVWCYRNGGGLDIWFRRSTDGGATFQMAEQLSPSSYPGYEVMGDCLDPRIVVEGNHLYVAWQQLTDPYGDEPLGNRVLVACSDAGGVRGSWDVSVLGGDARDTSTPEIAASQTDGNHNLFVLYQCSGPGIGRPLRLATSTDAGETFTQTVVEPTAPDQDGDRAVAADGDSAYAAYVGPTGDVKLYSRSISTGAEKRNSFAETDAFGTRIVTSGTGKLCAAWTTFKRGLDTSRIEASASMLDTTTLSGTKTPLTLGGGDGQSMPDLAWTGDAFMASWLEMPQTIEGGQDRVCIGRVRPGGGLTDAKSVFALESRPSGTRYFGRLAQVAGAGGLVALGWWDQMAIQGCTAVSRDGGVTFDSPVYQGIWTNGSGMMSLASNGSSASPAVHATWMGNQHMDEGTYNVEVDTYTKRLGAVGDDNLALEKLRVVQAPWDESPTQRLAKDKKTAFRVDVANGFATAITTQVELRYTQTTGGTPAETLMTQPVTIAPFDTKAVYFSGIRLTGDSVTANAKVNPGNSPAETVQSDNEASLTSREIVETQKIDALYIPILLPGDTAPTTAQFSSAMGSWARYIADAYPIDDDHWLKRSTWTTNWTPDLPGYTPGADLTVEQYNSMQAQLSSAAKVTDHEVGLGVVRAKWFADNAPAGDKDAVGLAPFNSKHHVGVEEAGQPPQIGAHEIAHTYGLVPPGTPGEMTGDYRSHFDRLIATGYSASRGEIVFNDPKNPPFDFMQYTAVANTWVSPFTYYTLMDRLSLTAVDPPVVLLSGVVDKAALTADVLPAYRFDSEADVELGTTGDLRIVFKGAGDTELDSAGFNPSFTRTGAGLSGTTEADTAAFSVRVPWVDGTEKIELVYDGTSVATLAVSPSAPTVTISSPAAGAEFNVGETVTASWIGVDADGGTLRYTPMLSIDDGASWTPLCGETTDTTFEFVPTRPMVTEKAKVKVMVTDGVNSGVDVTGAFAIRPVVPTGAGGGGVPTWGPVLGFEKPTDANGLDETKWAIGANGDTVYAGWIDENDLWDFKDHLRIMKSTNRGTTWAPAVDMSGPMDLDGGSEDAIEMQVFTFVGDTVYTLSFERIDADNRKLVVRKSTDGGASVETSSVVTTSKNSPNYPNVQRPRMVVDGERLYVLAGVVASATKMETWLYSSDDGGDTWSGPTVVSSTPWNGEGAMGQAEFCAKGDDVYVALQRRNANSSSPYYDAAVAYSHDGGASFSAPEVVIPNASYPTVAADGANVHVAGVYYESPTATGLRIASSDNAGGTFGAVTDPDSSAVVDSDIGGPRLLASGDKVTALWRGRVEVSPGVYRYPLYSLSSTDGGQAFAAPVDLLAGVAVNSQAPWGDPLYTKVRTQGDSIYLATQIYEHYTDPFGGSKDVKRLAVFTSTDFGATWGAPDVTTLDPPNEDTNVQTVLGCTPGLVYAGAGIDTYFTEPGLSAFLRVGSTGSAPAIAAGDDLAVSEGQMTSVTADFSADDAAGATATIDWGDGTVSTGIVEGAGTTGTVDAAHAYGAYGTYHATVCLGAGGQSAEDTFTVTVDNVAPSVSAPDTSTTTVGLPWQSGGISFSDAGWNDPLTATIDWGDGVIAPATVRVTSPGGDGEAQAGSIDATHTYSAPDTYTVLVTVDDGVDEATATYSVVAQVNHDPVADAGGPYTVDEGSQFSLDGSATIDVDGNALTYDWTLDGEALGSPFMDNRTLWVSLADDGSYDASVRARDGRGGADTAAATITVVNVAPSVEATTPRSISLHRPYSIAATELATFSDPGILDTHTAVVDWGDGSTSAGTVTESGGAGNVTGGHTYAASGDYTVNVTVTDKDGGTDSAAFALTVTAINTNPVASDLAVSTVAGVSVAVNLLASDPDGDPLSWLGTPVVAPLSGTLSGAAPALVYTPQPDFTGTDVFSFQVSDGNGGAAIAHVTVTVVPPPTKVSRVTGADRYQVALASSRATFPAGKSSRVVIASGERWDDALAASGLAGTLSSPVLLTKAKSLPTGLYTELKRLGAKRVYIVGNSSSVSTAITAKLKASGFTVVRITGANRYEVAKNVAYKIEAFRGNNKVTKAFVVRGDAFYDAMSVSSIAYSRKMPILYTPNKTMSANTAKAIRVLDIDEVIIAGHTSAVSSGVARSLNKLPSVDKVTRWSGTGAITTNIAVAKGALARGWISYGFVGMVDRATWVDGLSASSATGYRRGPILYVYRTSIPSATRAVLAAHRAEIRTLWVFARTSIINDPVLTSVRGVVD